MKTKKYVESLIPFASDFNDRFRDFAAIEKKILLFTSPFSVDPNEATKNLQRELIVL